MKKNKRRRRKEEGGRRKEKWEEETRRRRKAMRVGSARRVSGYQWNTGTILFTILSRVRGRTWGRRSGTSTRARCPVPPGWNTLLHKVKETRTKREGRNERRRRKLEDSIHVVQNAGPLKELSLSRGLDRCLHGDPLDWTDSYTRGPATSLNCEFRRVPHRQSSASQTSLFPRRRMTDLWY